MWTTLRRLRVAHISTASTTTTTPHHRQPEAFPNCNWYSFFCTSDIGDSFAADQIGGTPWHHEEKLWSASPLRYADQAVTPTLFINGDSDYLTWKAEGIQMFSALQYHGVDSRLVLFHGENHKLSTAGRPRSRLQRLREILMWFDHHLSDS